MWNVASILFQSSVVNCLGFSRLPLNQQLPSQFSGATLMQEDCTKLLPFNSSLPFDHGIATKSPVTSEAFATKDVRVQFAAEVFGALDDHLDDQCLSVDYSVQVRMLVLQS